MVRVGGGWDTLQNYLDKHDPCRCRRGEQYSTVQYSTVQYNTIQAVSVTGDIYLNCVLMYICKKDKEQNIVKCMKYFKTQ